MRNQSLFSIIDIFMRRLTADEEIRRKSHRMRPSILATDFSTKLRMSKWEICRSQAIYKQCIMISLCSTFLVQSLNREITTNNKPLSLL